MQHQYFDLHQLNGGEVVEVQLANAANVRLMDSSNYSSYKRDGQHRYIGGYVKQSPYRMTVPNSGHWYVAIDLGGHAGTIRSAVRVLPGILPTARNAPLSSVPSLRLDRSENPEEDNSVREYDVFVSHASEDKESVARPIAEKLREFGLRVWFDEFELKIGDSLRRKIDKGLANSKFGIVILSKSFIKKGWANYELDGIITKSVSGQQVILPIWHDITKQEVIDYSPSLADKLARNTAINTIEEIAEEIKEVVSS
ncbi:MAG: DUF1883 domain-containing protein [Pseudomonadota bacterium]